MKGLGVILIMSILAIPAYAALAYEKKGKKIDLSVFLSGMIPYPKYFIKGVWARVKNEKESQRAVFFSVRFAKIIIETILYFPFLFPISYIELLIEYQELKESGYLDKILEEIEEENELYKVKKELRKQFYGTHTA